MVARLFCFGFYLDARRWQGFTRGVLRRFFEALTLSTRTESETKMTITLHAQPYDVSATGFYFTSAEEYRTKAKNLRNAYGDPVEEFEIQFIDGERIDCEVAKAIGLNQANFADYLDCAEAWEDWQKINVIIATGDLGHAFDPHDDPDHYGIDLYHVGSYRELAELFVEEGLFGEVPESFQFYIDYEAIARDLTVDYSDIEIAGDRLIYRAA
jgi:hypothetical protein